MPLAGEEEKTFRIRLADLRPPLAYSTFPSEIVGVLRRLLGLANSFSAASDAFPGKLIFVKTNFFIHRNELRIQLAVLVATIKSSRRIVTKSSKRICEIGILESGKSFLGIREALERKIAQ